MRFSKAALLAVVATAVAAGPAAAPATAAKRSKAAKPKITRVMPMRIEVGERLVIRGRNFRPRARLNTVVFKGRGVRVALARPARATRRKIVLRVPRSAAQLLRVTSSAATPTRLRLRIISRRRAGSFTRRRLSPVVVVASSCDQGANSDADLLSDAEEARFGLDPCDEDSDDDGLIDGWEFYAAKDLNIKAVPYPGKRPYPNPLDGKDPDVDFDGDGLSAVVEHALWRYTGSEFDPNRLGRGTPGSPLGYSDGTQTSRPDITPPVPAFMSPSHGIPFDPPAYPGRLKARPGPWRDDERDADRDGLNNYVEVNGPGSFGWWEKWLALESVPPWPESYFGTFGRRPFADVDVTDPDIDGDGLLDGEDDQDNDDVLNFVEMYEPAAPWAPDGTRKNPFNPCAPDRASRTCPLYIPF